MQTQFKKTSSDLVLFATKLLSGAVIGLTVALIVEEVLGYSEGENLLIFLFVIFAVVGVFVRLVRSWGMTAILVFDLICVLAGMLLKLYIMAAPGL